MLPISGTSPRKSAKSCHVHSPLHANANRTRGVSSRASLARRLVVGARKIVVGRAAPYGLVCFLLLIGVSMCWLKGWLPVDKSKENSSYNVSLLHQSKNLSKIAKHNHSHLVEHNKKGVHITLESGYFTRKNQMETTTMDLTGGRNTIVIVGGGLAGCSAAIKAAKRGARVVLLEKEARLGGNSAKATSGINGWGTRAQGNEGIRDSDKHFKRDTYLSGRTGNCRPELVEMLSAKSGDAVEWLTELGVPLSVLSQLGGHSRKRTHRAPDREDGTPVPIGFAIMRRLEEIIRGELRDSIQVETTACLSRLLHESVTLPTGETATVVRGVEYQKYRAEDGTSETVRLYASANVLATGGFSNDRTMGSLLREYAPGLMDYPTTNGVWATGDGVKVARELGAELVDMDKVQLHPTGMINPKDPQAKTLFLGPEALRGSGGILLNKKGERFINELGLRSVVSQAIIAQGDEFPNSPGRKFAHCVLNDAAAQLFGKGALGFYWKRMGLFQYVENVHELAALIGCEESTLLRTLQSYKDLSSSDGKCPLTGKDVFPCVMGAEGPFYVTYVTPSIHYTMGGCLISPSAEILTVDKTDAFGRHRPILGLFGAGEVTGGVHGGNRLGGNSLLECVVFGRIAGERAAQTALEGPLAQDAGSLRGRPVMGPTSWTRGMVQQLLPDDPAPGSVANAGSERGYRLVISLPSAFQISGLALLQSILLKPCSGDVQPLRVVPTSLPEELGVVSISLPSLTERVEAIPVWVYSLQPGDEVEMQTGPVEASVSALNKRLAQVNRGSEANLVICATAPEGVNPMVQLLRASLRHPLQEKMANVRLLYAAKDLTEMRYLDILKGLCGEKVECRLVLENSPTKWTEEVEMDESTVKKILPATADPSQFIVVVLTHQAEKMSLLKKFFETKHFVEGSSLFIVAQ